MQNEIAVCNEMSSNRRLKRRWRGLSYPQKVWIVEKVDGCTDFKCLDSALKKVKRIARKELADDLR